MSNKICLIPECQSIVKAKGYCNLHYERIRRNGDPDALLRERHGLRNSKEYGIWNGMIQRCSNVNHIGYLRYGGRGITVCGRWKNSFKAFYEDMGPRPSDMYEIDRIDNDGNYEPGNCRWVLHSTNSRNASFVKLNLQQVEQIRYLYSTGLYSQRKIAEMFNVCRDTIYKIVNKKLWK